LGFIVPNKFMQADYGVGLRDIIATRKALVALVDFNHAQVFANATTYTCLLFLSGSARRDSEVSFNTGNADPNSFLSGRDVEKLPLSNLSSEPWSLAYSAEARVLRKVERGGKPLPEVLSVAITGVKTGANDVFVFDECRPKGRLCSVRPEGAATHVTIERAILKPYWKAESMKRYSAGPARRLLLYPYRDVAGRTVLISQTEMAQKYPRALAYLASHKPTLEARQKGGLKGPNWYGLSFASATIMFDSHKIVTATLAPTNSFTIDDGAHYFPQGAGGGCGLIPKPSISPLYLLGLLNSKVLSFYFQHISSRFQGGWYAYEPRYLARLPVHLLDMTRPDHKARHDKMVELVTRMMELKKQQARAPKKQSPSARQLLDQKLAITDQQIDALVYELYGLTEQEIRVVEGAT
jgi:hypothetical protein